MQPRSFSRRFFLSGGLLCLLICVLTLATPSALALSGKIRDFPIPTPNGGAAGITAGPDGNLWFTDLSAPGHIGRISPVGKHKVTEFPTNQIFPGAITAGPDGNLWFGDGNNIGQLR